MKKDNPLNIHEPSSHTDGHDEALSWQGDNEAGLFRDENIAPITPPANTSGEENAPEPVALAAPSVWPVIFGAFGGVYILYVVGWALHIFTHQIPYYDVLSAIMGELGEALAIVGPVFWFFAVLVIVPARRPVMRLIWLIIGAVVMIPWPFVLNAVVSS